jgi:F-type H+-transporting ATPase subunit gamma
MSSLKEVKRRINSIKSTRKITSAMQMVSSAKLHQAQTALTDMLPYEERLHYMLVSFIHEEKYLHVHGYPGGLVPLRQSPYVQLREIKKVAIIVITSNSGLCGAYNEHMEKYLYSVLKEYEQIPRSDITIYPIGQKIANVALSTGCNVCQYFIDLAIDPTYQSCSRLSRKLGMEYMRGSVDKVELLYHHFKNIGVQQLRRTRFLPFDYESVKETNPSYGRELKGKQGLVVPQETFSAQEQDPEYFCGYLFEPSRQELIDYLLPNVLRFQLFRAILDSNASEHAARTMAMKIATDNADDLIDDLTVQYNKSRQQAITNELLDIAGGAMK